MLILKVFNFKTYIYYSLCKVFHHESKYSIFSNFFFTFSLSFSQIASYKFENNLNDEIGNYTAFHTKNGVINNQIEFRNEGDGYENVILLDSTQGIFLPKTLNSKLDFSKSIEFIFDFKITDLGSSSGRKEILELSRGWNDNTEGINIWTDKINDNRYKVILNYTDGGYILLS